MPRPPDSLVVSVVVVLALLWPRVVSANDETQSSGSSTGGRLDVPFIAQTPALCGGAAVAMVAHYWGHRDIQVADFTPLVDTREQGIRADRLRDAVARRGWTAWAFRGDAEIVRRHLRRGRPLIALIDDESGGRHYVVIVAWGRSAIVVHDPARGPGRVVRVDRFERVWGATDRLTLLLLPPAPSNRTSALDSSRPPPACGGLLSQAIDAARANRFDHAEASLAQALVACPHSSRPRAELAGLRLRQGRWQEAVQLAEQAVRLDAKDRYAWRVLAAGRFLAGDTHHALEAWNEVDEPHIDLIDVEGLARTRASVVHNVIELAPRAVLVDERLQHARRRLEALPTVTSARIGYRPRADGQADVDIQLRERPLLFDGVADASWTLGRALVERRVKLAVSSPTGGGEPWTADWRWERHRPRVAIGLVVPQRPAIGGLWRIDALWARDSFAASTADAPIAIATETRRRVSLQVSDWASARLRWSAGAGLDQWDHRGHHLSVDLGVETRDPADHRTIWAETSIWMPLHARSAFSRWEIGAAWRRPSSSGKTTWRAGLGLQGVSAHAPLGLWPRPDSGRAGTMLLRAHPAVRDGIVRPGRLGRLLAGSTVEFERRLGQRGPIGAGLVMFTDVARPWGIPSPHAHESGLQIDAGVGLRLDVPGSDDRLRLDVGRGLRQGGTVLSIGWTRSWTHRP